MSARAGSIFAEYDVLQMTSVPEEEYLARLVRICQAGCDTLYSAPLRALFEFLLTARDVKLLYLVGQSLSGFVATTTPFAFGKDIDSSEWATLLSLIAKYLSVRADYQRATLTWMWIAPQLSFRRDIARMIGEMVSSWRIKVPYGSKREKTRKF